MSVRITGLQEVATLQNGDYIAIDNESNGTHKFDAMKMGANMASNIAPAYSTAATYAIGDFCMHDGILYKCTTAISTPESWTASHWTQTSAGVALAQKVDKVSGKGLSQNDFTDALKTKLDGIASGAEVNVQADWAQTNTSADDYIKNKPVDATASVSGLMSASDKAKLDGIASGAEVNVQANWTETNTSSDAYIKNKPTNATSSTAGLMSAADKAKLDGIASGAEVNVQADWSQTNTSADDYIKNKPVDATSSVGGLMSATDKAKLDSIEQGAEVNVQADWNQTNTSADDYIKNKPTNATTSTAGLMSASDKTKLNGIETGAQVNVIDGVKVDGTLLAVDGNKDVDIVGKANQASLAPQYSSDTGNYVRGNYVIYQNNLYKCLQDTSGVWDATKWEQVDIGDDLEQKANIDGLYEEMTVGGAEQLISDTFNIESVPYNFRTSGGSLDIGDRETDKLIGGTVGWNQLIQNGNFDGTTHFGSRGGQITASNNILTYTVSTVGTTTYYNELSQERSVPANHKVLVEFDIKSAHTHPVLVFALNTTGNPNKQIPVNGGEWVHASTIFGGITSDVYAFQLAFNCQEPYGYAVNDVEQVKNYKIHDLTAMFGTTIADYIYSLEQNTTGAGVSFFKKLFPAPYYAYNAGQLMSVNAGSHVMNGFNQWDPSTGTAKVIAGMQYEVVGAYTSLSLGGITITPVDGMFTPNTTGTLTVVGGDDTTTCIHLVWDGERNGEYEPYVSHTYELDDTLELRGIPKLDANNQLYYDGDVYESDGSVTRKYGEVDLGTLSWLMSTAGESVFYADVNGIKIGVANTQSMLACSKYASNRTVSGAADAESIGNGYITKCYHSNYPLRIYIKDTNYSTAADFKTAMGGVYLVYEFATSTSESATPYTNPQIVDDWGTETYTDYSYDAQTRDVQIPVGHETRYMANLKAKLEMAPESPNGDGDYIVRQTSGENAYVAIGSSPTIQHKAEIDGTYDDMNVGGAKQLLSNVFEEDQVPYTFRTSGGSIDIGDREYDEIVGGTIAWNQLSKPTTIAITTNGVSISPNASGGVTLNNTATASGALGGAYAKVSGLSGHKYLLIVTGSAVSKGISVYSSIGGAWAGTQAIKSAGVSTEFDVTLRCDNGASFSNDNAWITTVDLTQMFGTTIADYIYSLEQATTGAGVAWFRKLFPKPYYEYNVGELLSVEGVSSHDMTGFNQWDEEWEVGGINTSDGQPVPSLTSIRSKNFISVVPSVTYYITTNNPATYAWFYDADKNFIGFSTSTANQAFDTPSNCAYIKLRAGDSGHPLQTYNHDICLSLHWDGERDGEYEPYELHSYPLDDSLTLRGIPKLDASNNLYYDGDTYESDGTVTRKYGIVDLGTLTWTYITSTTNPVFTADITGTNAIKVGVLSAIPNIQNAKYGIYASAARSTLGANMPDKNMSVITGYSSICVRDSAYTDAATFKTAMSGVYLVYELATPTTETANPFQSPQIVDDWGTEEYVTTSIVPVGHDTKYTANLRAKIEMAPDSPSGDGDYIVRQADGTNSYVPLVIPNELPTMPTTDGNWVLRCTVSSGTATLSWVSAT